MNYEGLKQLIKAVESVAEELEKLNKTMDESRKEARRRANNPTDSRGEYL